MKKIRPEVKFLKELQDNEIVLISLKGCFHLYIKDVDYNNKAYYNSDTKKWYVYDKTLI